MPSQNFCISPKPTIRLLSGYWISALTVEGFVALCHVAPIVLWILLVNNVTTEQSAVGCVLLLWGDLLLLSPLKAGKALFYSYIAKKKTTVKFSTIFYFFKTRYRRTVRWRLKIWLTRYAYWLMALLPCSALLFWERYLQSHPVTSAIAFLLAVVLGTFAIVFTEIRMLRYLAVPYLLSSALSVKEIFELSKTIFSKQLNNLTNFYIIHGYWIVVPPIFYTARAVTVNTTMQEFAKQPLQHWKNHGKILSELYLVLEEL